MDPSLAGALVSVGGEDVYVLKHCNIAVGLCQHFHSHRPHTRVLNNFKVFRVQHLPKMTRLQTARCLVEEGVQPRSKNVDKLGTLINATVMPKATC